MPSKINIPRGTKDVTPDEIFKWHYIEKTAAAAAADFGFREIRFPAFEHTELFVRGVGDTTDVVQKEMYTFLDKGNRSITLRPEGTASVVRSYIENSLFSSGLPVKAYYLSSIFRYEKPQAGRFREHHQFGAECFGPASAEADCELISLGAEYLSRLGIKKANLEINSIGCPECRPAYHKALIEYFSSHKDSLCQTCLERLEKNPVRILDCKSEQCGRITKDAPAGLDYLCSECAGHFDSLRSQLDEIGIEYIVNPRIVRGLDYYTKTVFEFIHPALGLTLIGGGRYDGLVSVLGGNHTPALGFGSGIERMLLALEADGAEIPAASPVSVFIASQSPEGQIAAQNLVYNLRKKNIAAECDLMRRSLKAQMKYADKLNAKYSMVIGENELQTGVAVIKNMNTGESVQSRLDAGSIALLMQDAVDNGAK